LIRLDRRRERLHLGPFGCNRGKFAALVGSEILERREVWQLSKNMFDRRIRLAYTASTGGLSCSRESGKSDSLT
jgi:hypothetical protein